MVAVIFFHMANRLVREAIPAKSIRKALLSLAANLTTAESPPPPPSHPCT
jgi:hypothetical protein